MILTVLKYISALEASGRYYTKLFILFFILIFAIINYICVFFVGNFIRIMHELTTDYSDASLELVEAGITTIQESWYNEAQIIKKD